MPCCSLSGGLSVMARDAERLQVGAFKTSPTAFDGDNVIDHRRSHEPPERLTTCTQRALA